MNKPLLSIIIPTKNRYTTLLPVVDMILSFDSIEDIEVVIQDNSDDNREGLSYMKTKNDASNLYYFHEAENLSVTENSDKAVFNSNGEFVCFIGDDDGVMPYITQVAKWMKTNNIKALKNKKPQYYWPNQQSNYLSKDVSGILNTFRNYSQKIEIKNTEETFNSVLAKGGTTMGDMPCLYHGIVRRDALEAIYNKTGTFFPGPSPDMANATALSLILESFAYADFPVVISGKSTKSTGGAGILHQHLAKIEEVAHLPKNTASKWSKEIPKYWTGPTIWAESIVKALENMGYENFKEKINFTYLYAHLMVFNKSNKEQIFTDFQFEKKTSYYKYLVEIFAYRTVVFVKNRLHLKHKNINGVSNIKEAIERLEKQVGKLQIQ